MPAAAAQRPKPRRSFKNGVREGDRRPPSMGPELHGQVRRTEGQLLVTSKITTPTSFFFLARRPSKPPPLPSRAREAFPPIMLTRTEFDVLARALSSAPGTGVPPAPASLRRWWGGEMVFGNDQNIVDVTWGICRRKNSGDQSPEPRYAYGPRAGRVSDGRGLLRHPDPILTFGAVAPPLKRIRMRLTGGHSSDRARWIFATTKPWVARRNCGSAECFRRSMKESRRFPRSYPQRHPYETRVPANATALIVGNRPGVFAALAAALTLSCYLRPAGCTVRPPSPVRVPPRARGQRALTTFAVSSPRLGNGVSTRSRWAFKNQDGPTNIGAVPEDSRRHSFLQIWPQEKIRTRWSVARSPSMDARWETACSAFVGNIGRWRREKKKTETRRLTTSSC